MNISGRRPRRASALRLPGWLCGSGPESDIVISTRMRLARNLSGCPFPSQASPRQRTSVFNKVCGAVEASKGFSAVNFASMEPLDRHYLVERRIATPDLISMEGDRGVAFDGEGRISVLINEEDHLRMQCLMPGCMPIESWECVDVLDDGLGMLLDFAFERRRGFLTCCPTNSGTGLRVSFQLHLPALILTRSLDPVLQGACRLGIAVRGFFGEHSDVVGGFFQLSNQASMGADEREFIEATGRTVREIVDCEKRARKRLLEEASLELSDKIYRAYGILAYARTLSVAEFLNCASALRLGADTGLLSEVPVRSLNMAMLAVMPAHLQKSAGRTLDERELSVFRADRVRELIFKKKSLFRGSSGPRKESQSG
jgi:protein arginine kinase